jgi:hypothetical protein
MQEQTMGEKTPNAYMLFMAFEKRKMTMDPKDMANELSRRWKALDEAKKELWKQRAEELKVMSQPPMVADPADAEAERMALIKQIPANLRVGVIFEMWSMHKIIAFHEGFQKLTTEKRANFLHTIVRADPDLWTQEPFNHPLVPHCDIPTLGNIFLPSTLYEITQFTPFGRLILYLQGVHPHDLRVDAAFRPVCPLIVKRVTSRTGMEFIKVMTFVFSEKALVENDGVYGSCVCLPITLTRIVAKFQIIDGIKCRTNPISPEYDYECLPVQTPTPEPFVPLSAVPCYADFSSIDIEFTSWEQNAMRSRNTNLIRRERDASPHVEQSKRARKQADDDAFLYQLVDDVMDDQNPIAAALAAVMSS